MRPERRLALVRRREIAGLSQDELASRLGVERSTVVRWEAGRTTPQPWSRPRLAGALGVSLHTLDELLSPAAPASPVGAVAIADAGGADLIAMHSFRAADKQVGGHTMYGQVTAYLHTQLAPRLFGTAPVADRGAMFAAAAALTEMAGWMAHDAGNDGIAATHFGHSLDLAQLGGDTQLTAHIAGSRAHLALHQNNAGEAIIVARDGLTFISSAAAPRLTARLYAMQARGHAALGDASECRAYLARATAALSRTEPEQPSPWVSHFDEGALAAEAARCMCDVGDYAEAGRQASRVIELRPAERARSWAFGQLALAAVLVRQRELDAACAHTVAALHGTRSLGSYLVVQQFNEIVKLTMPYQTTTVVADLHGQLAAALRERRWISTTPESAA